MNAVPDTSLLADLRALPPRYWVLFAGTLINRFGHFVMPFLALYLKREGYPTWVTGTALAGYGAGGLLAGLLGGWCADRFGRKPTIAGSCGAAAVAMLLLAGAREPGAIIAASALVGLTSAMYFPASSALLADLVPEPLRVRAFGCQRLAVNLGFALGMMTAGMLAAHSFLVLFIVDAATTAALGLIVMLGLPRGLRRRPANAGWGVALRAMRVHGAYLRALAASFCIAIVFWQMSSSYGLQVTAAGGFSERVYGGLMALNGLMIVAFELPLTSWTRRHPVLRVMVVGYLLVGLGMGLNALGAGLPMLVISMLVFTLGEMIALPVAHSHIASIAPADMRGRFMGVLGMSWSAATMLGPAAGVALFVHAPALVWLGCLGLGMLAAIIIAGTRLPEVEKACASGRARAGMKA